MNGTLTVMWSGSKTRFDELQPVLLSFARSFFIDDKPGQKQALKPTAQSGNRDRILFAEFQITLFRH